MQRLRALVASDGFRSTILFLIVLNAIAMGLEATPAAAEVYSPTLEWVLLLSQVVFVAEIVARWLAEPRDFFRDSWNRFDFAVVALSLIPAIGAFALVARVFRVLRVLRIASVGDVLMTSVLREEVGTRTVVLAVCLALLFGYVFALTGYYLFGETQSEWGSLVHSTRQLVTSLRPTGVLDALDSPGPVLALHLAFYAILLLIAVNLGRALLRRPGGTAP